MSPDPTDLPALSLSLASSELVDVERASLDQLAEMANAEYQLAEDSAETAIKHAIRCGAALAAAKEIVPPGDWHRWCDNNVTTMKRWQVVLYMRIAHYRRELPSSVTTPEVAREILRGLPNVSSGAPRRITDEQCGEVVALRDEGLSFNAIAKQTGLGVATVYRIAKPPLRAEILRRQQLRRQREIAARQALKRQERDRLARQVKSPASEAYALIRRTAQILDQAAVVATSNDERATLRHALSSIHQAEDAVVRSLRLASR